MRGSRKERHAREARRSNGKAGMIAINAVIVLFLLSGIYYIWDANWNRSPDVVESTDPVIEDVIPETQSDRTEDGDTGAVDEPVAVEEMVDPVVTLAFVGDMMLNGRIGDLARKEGYDYPYRHVKDWLQDVDIAAGNLESPITDQGEPHENKQYTYRTSPDAVAGMKEAGFDVFNLANNHTIDYGMIGLFDSLKYLDEAGIGRVGAGRSEAEAYEPYWATVHDMRIAFFGFTHVVMNTSWKAKKDKPGLAELYDYRPAVQAIEKARPDADLVVVMTHWGIEREDEPPDFVVDKAHRLIDAGADLVIGSHPHVLQGLEHYNGKWIAYSMGNFIFPNTANPDTNVTAIMRASCDKEGNCKLSVVPCAIGVGQPYPLEGDAAQAIIDRLNRLSIGASIDENGEVTIINREDLTTE